MTTRPVQALAFKKEGSVSKQMLKYIETVSKESWVELQGVVQIPKEKDGSRQPITGTSQQVNIKPSKSSKKSSLLVLCVQDMLRNPRSHRPLQDSGL